MSSPMPSQEILNLLRQGVVIPACPLALDKQRKPDEVRQRALIRYYVAAGVGGIAVGVHTTQFEIRDPGVDLLRPVLQMTAAAIREASRKSRRTIVTIAGICGKTEQAVREAELAASLGFDLGLLSLAALAEAPEDELVEHCRRVSKVIPLMGFYLQPAVGGRILPHIFWRQFAEIENLVAIKIAPFNRYQTLDVMRAVAESGREDEIALYTGNDDNIIMDLLTPYTFKTMSGEKTLRIRGGLLGQWAVWTKRAVEILDDIHTLVREGRPVPLDMFEKNIELTDANAAIFDVANDFVGCIPGIHEVLKRQGLMEYTHCVDPKLALSPGQKVEIDRVYRAYAWLNDDDFVSANLDAWLQ